MAETLDTHRRRLRRLGAGRRAFQRCGPSAAQEARDDGMSVSEISRLLGMTRAGVLDLIRRASVVAVVAVALVVTLGAAPADAHVTRGMDDWQEIGRAYFPGACGPVEFDASHRESPLTPYAPAWAYSPFRGHGECRIVLGPYFHLYSSREQCRMIVHEYGHLAGHDHSDDPASIMHPNGATPKECGSKRIRRHTTRMHAGSRR